MFCVCWVTCPRNTYTYLASYMYLINLKRGDVNERLICRFFSLKGHFVIYGYQYLRTKPDRQKIVTLLTSILFLADEDVNTENNVVP